MTMLSDYLQAEHFPPDKNLFSAKEVAELFAFTEHTVEKMIDDQSIGASKIKNTFYVTRDNLESFFEHNFDRLNSMGGHYE